MTTTSKSSPVVLAVIGPKVISVAYTMHKGAPDNILTAPTSTYAPASRNFADKADHAAAVADWAESQTDRGSDYIGAVALAKSNGARIVAIVSQSAVKHDPSGKVYSNIAGVETVLAGIGIVADETITVA